MSKLTSYQETMLANWNEHGRAEIVLRSPDATIATMSANPYIFEIPLGRRHVGRDAVYSYYKNDFLTRIPPDFEIFPIRRVIGEEHIVDESVGRFTHSVEMPFMMPGVPPTERRAETIIIAIVGFEGGKVAYEHLMWDHAALLSQLGIVQAPQVGIGTPSPAELLKITGPVQSLKLK